MALMISNVYANTHSKNMIASHENVEGLLASSVMALLAHGLALVDPSFHSMRQ